MLRALPSATVAGSRMTHMAGAVAEQPPWGPGCPCKQWLHGDSGSNNGTQGRKDGGLKVEDGRELDGCTRASNGCAFVGLRVCWGARLPARATMRWRGAGVAQQPQMDQITNGSKHKAVYRHSAPRTKNNRQGFVVYTAYVHHAQIRPKPRPRSPRTRQRWGRQGGAEAPRPGRWAPRRERPGAQSGSGPLPTG